MLFELLHLIFGLDFSLVLLKLSVGNKFGFLCKFLLYQFAASAFAGELATLCQVLDLVAPTLLRVSALHDDEGAHLEVQQAVRGELRQRRLKPDAADSPIAPSIEHSCAHG